MAQHDYTIANQGFPAFRSDLNDALAAVVSNNSGATEPSTMFAHQIWVDTAADPSILKIRNADNDAWITIGSIDQTGDTFTLVNLRTSGPVVFNDAGADVDFRVEGDTDANLLFVDASADKVGVGTGSPSYKLDVVSTSMRIASGTTGVGYVQYGNSATASQNWHVGTEGDGTYRFYNGNFGSGSLAVTLDSSGNVLVGTTSNYGGRRLDLRGDNAGFIQTITNSNAGPAGLQIFYSTASPNNGASAFLYCQDATTARMTVNSNGGISNYSANNVNLSDRREKTNFAPAKNYLDTICAIPIQTFNYIDQNLEEDDGLTLGVVAQDVQEVAPELVMESNWGTEEEPKMRLSIYQTDLQYALMKCIQELKAELDTVKAELATLKG